MIDGKKVIAVIPARGGSKGVPRKNIRVVGGMPLIAYTINSARKSKYLDQIVVSTEDPEIKKIAQSYHVEVIDRPQTLAQDETPGIDPVLHVLDHYKDFDYIVLLQPTSPLRSAEDIDGTLQKCFVSKAPVCVSVTEAATSPYRVFQLSSEEKLQRFVEGEVSDRRQDLPLFYELNGAVYVADTDWLKKNKRFMTKDTVAFSMPLERSLDIDTEQDMLYFEFISQKG